MWQGSSLITSGCQICTVCPPPAHDNSNRRVVIKRYKLSCCQWSEHTLPDWCQFECQMTLKLSSKYRGQRADQIQTESETKHHDTYPLMTFTNCISRRSMQMSFIRAYKYVKLSSTGCDSTPSTLRGDNLSKLCSMKNEVHVIALCLRGRKLCATVLIVLQWT